MKRWLVASAVVAAAIVQLVRPAAARDHMWIVGSHAMQPFTKAVAERVARSVGAPAPVVEDTGTSPGFGYLCAGSGAGHPDAVSATRRMRQAELDVCRSNGAGEIAEVPVGLDILVIAQAQAGPLARLTLAQLALAFARQLPDESGELVRNPHQTWSEVDRALPDARIDLRVLPPVAGTSEALQELFLGEGARKVPEITRLAAKGDALPKGVSTMREDPVVVIHESEAVIARQLATRRTAVGVLSYRMFHANRSSLRGLAIEGVEPTAENAYAGRYVGTRKLYLYVRKAELTRVRGLGRLAAEYLSNAALGPDGYLLALGFVPLGAEDMIKTMALIDALPPVRREALPE